MQNFLLGVNDVINSHRDKSKSQTQRLAGKYSKNSGSISSSNHVLFTTIYIEEKSDPFLHSSVEDGQACAITTLLQNYYMDVAGQLAVT